MFVVYVSVKNYKRLGPAQVRHFMHSLLLLTSTPTPVASVSSANNQQYPSANDMHFKQDSKR